MPATLILTTAHGTTYRRTVKDDILHSEQQLCDMIAKLTAQASGPYELVMLVRSKANTPKPKIKKAA